MSVKKGELTELVKFDVNVFKKAGQIAKQLIVSDAGKGKFQGKPSGPFSYSNKGANIGWRKIKGKNVFLDSYKNFKSRGMTIPDYGKLPKFQGIQVNTDVSKVNMKLTGETLRRISVKLIKDGFKLVFAKGQIVEGNAKRNYTLNDLSSKNQDRLANFVGNILGKKLKLYIQKETNIIISK
jgi:hypothetical protein